MKIKVEIDDEITEDVILIQCKQLTDEILELQRQLSAINSGGQKLLVEKNDTEYYLDLKSLLFIEADGSAVAVHTATDIFHTKQKLYELETLLPRDFIRISKSGIVNSRMISSIKKNITGASEVSFRESSKKVYASRNYIKALLDLMDEKRIKK